MHRFAHLIKDSQLDLHLLEMTAKSLYYSTGLSTLIADANNKTLFRVGFNHRSENMFAATLKGYPQFVKTVLTEQGNGVQVFETEYHVSYIVVILSAESKFYGSIFLGPFTASEVDEHQINQILNAGNYTIEQRNMIKQAYASLPILSPSRSYYIQQLAMAASTNDQLMALFPPKVDFVGTDKLLNASELNTIDEIAKPAYNYPLEVLFLTKVKNGDLEKVISLYNENIRAQYLNQSSTNPLRTAKNRALAFSALMSRTVIDGGVDAERSLALEFQYGELIEDTHNVNELADLLEELITKYTNTVLQLSGINHVNVIKNASKYVHMHLSEPIRLNDVASFVNLSPNYFSSLFKREMNLSFADYVNQTRIKESQYLLETTDYPILDIAISVGYNNQNYFTTIFRKFTGITPKQYRMRNAK